MSSIKKLAKEMSGTIKPKQYHERKMSQEELQNHLKTLRNGVSISKNKKKQHPRQTKYKHKF